MFPRFKFSKLLVFISPIYAFVCTLYNSVHTNLLRHVERNHMTITMTLGNRIAAAAVVCFVLTAMASGQTQSPQQLAWSILQGGTSNSNVEQRVTAVSALAVITADPKAVTTAEQALQDPNPSVRSAAATTLGVLKSTSSIPKLEQALKDTDPAVIMSAANALVQMNNEQGYDTYYAVATGQLKGGEGLVGSQKQELNTLLHNPKDLAETAFEQGIGFVPFGGIGFGAFKAIHDSGQNAILVKATAYKMLAKDPDPRSEKALINATADPQWQVRAAAYDALAKRGDKSVLSQISNGLTDQQQQVQYAAAATVAQLSALR